MLKFHSNHVVLYYFQYLITNIFENILGKAGYENRKRNLYGLMGASMTNKLADVQKTSISYQEFHILIKRSYKIKNFYVQTSHCNKISLKYKLFFKYFQIIYSSN